MGEPLNGMAMVAVCAGILFVWSGIKGWSILGVAGDLALGVKPAQENVYSLYKPDTAPDGIGSGPSGYSASGYASSDTLANTALQYDGHPYKFGGAPGRNAENAWDCSSMVNWIVGVKHGRMIPGYGPGKYTGTSHGPPTGSWGVWPGLQRVPRSSVQAGDILVWVGHMGIAISNEHYMSALNPRVTTKVRTIDGQGKNIMIFGRLKN